MKVEEIVEEILQLPEPQKTETVRRILDAIEMEWEEKELLQEAERRDKEMDSDPTTVLSEKEFIDSFASRLEKTA